MNYANINDNPFVIYYGAPTEWKGVLGYNYSNPEQLLKDGFQELRTPAYNSQTQYLGPIIQEEDYFTYQVLDYSVEEIQAKLIADAEVAQQNLIDETIKNQATKAVLDTVQAETDVAKILENQAIYPLWKEGLSVKLKEKYQDISDTNEIWLWEVAQAHTTQFHPKDVPALFKRVAKDGEILVWKQPTGAHDSYMNGDVVWFPTLNSTKYKSKIDNNVYSPTAYPAGWEIVN